jgi:16S rRNA (guanine527-N7)-methyltransferase
MILSKENRILEAAINQCGFQAHPKTINQFSIYRELIKEWNKKINLVSRGDVEYLITKHFLPSIGFLSTIKFPIDVKILDLGSGAGFPGIPMKILRPDFEMILLDSNRMKSLFLKHVIEELHLPNIKVIIGRAEEMNKKIEPVDFVVCRATSSLDNLMSWSRDLLKSGKGQLITIKGIQLQKELSLINKVKNDLGIKKWHSIKYDPFPSIFPLKNSYLVIIEKDK